MGPTTVRRLTNGELLSCIPSKLEFVDRPTANPSS
jgi:hypothetical protein